MSAVAEAPQTAFQCPRPALGQQVLWYPHADPHEEPRVAFVVQVGTRTIMVQVGGIPYDTVRHLSDPKLTANEEQRENGAWDFPETERELNSLREQVSRQTVELAKLAKKVSDLEAFLSEPAKESDKGKGK